jgi:hypothetical protein
MTDAEMLALADDLDRIATRLSVGDQKIYEAASEPVRAAAAFCRQRVAEWGEYREKAKPR